MTVSYSPTFIAPGGTVTASGVPLGRTVHWQWRDADGEWHNIDDTDSYTLTVPDDVAAEYVRICWGERPPVPTVHYTRLEGANEVWAPGNRARADFSTTEGITAYQWQYQRADNDPDPDGWLHSSAAGATTRTLTIPTIITRRHLYRISFTRFGEVEAAATYLGVTP